MSELKNVTSIEENKQSSVSAAETGAHDDVISHLVTQGVPSTFSPNNYISKIAQEFGISKDEARDCLKIAVEQLEKQKPQQKEMPLKENEETAPEQEKPQDAYYWDYGYKTSNSKFDGMDSLTALSGYNRTMFNVKITKR